MSMTSTSPNSDIKPRITSSPIKPFKEEEARSIAAASQEEVESEEFNLSSGANNQQQSTQKNHNHHQKSSNNNNIKNVRLTTTHCKHISRPIWSEDSKPNNDNHHHSHHTSNFHQVTIFRNLLIILKSLESYGNSSLSQKTSRDDNLFNPSNFCLNCKSITSPRVICLGCGSINCYSNEFGVRCYQVNHSSKSNKCRLGLDLTCRELICLVCGDIVQPDDSETKILARKLFPPVKKAYMPACLNRTTSNIFPPRGIRNLGSSCYMNVILQVILRIPELQCYLLTDHHNRLKHRTTEEINCCACELVEILQSNSTFMVNSKDQISPIGFLYCLWMNSGDGEDLAGYRESDAHECLLACLNQLHTVTQVPNTIDTVCQCPIHLLFRCELRSELVCGNCNISSHKSDPILDLSLEIGHLLHLKVLKLSDCLKSFTESEKLNEKCYTCTECGVASPNTSKSLKISQLPHILCIQLKRFEHHESGTAKLDRKVEFPLVLDMRPYTINPKDSSDLNSSGYYYKLMGIVRHQGNSSSGHYQAIVYQDEQYFCYNDGVVNILKLKEVLDVEAYLLIYSFILNP